MDIALRTQNITRVYRAATPDERTEGASWYATARELARSLDPENPTRAAAVIAVLSPMVKWDRNVEEALRAYRGERPRVLYSNADKAFRILAGEDPNNVVSGPKVRAFWHAIVDPTDVRAVVIDRHAFDVAAGRVLNDAQRGLILGRKGAYDRVCELYVRAARVLSVEFGREISPVEVQATTWVAWRRSKSGTTRIRRSPLRMFVDHDGDRWYEVVPGKVTHAQSRHEAETGPFSKGAGTIESVTRLYDLVEVSE